MGRQQVSKVSKGQRPLPLLWVACWMGSTDQILRLMNIESLAILEYLRPNLLLAWAPSKSPGEESRSRIDRRRWARLKSGTSFTVRSRPSSLPPACAGQGRRDSLGTPRSDSAVAHHRPLAVRQATIPLPSPPSSPSTLSLKKVRCCNRVIIYIAPIRLRPRPRDGGPTRMEGLNFTTE